MTLGTHWGHQEASVQEWWPFFFSEKGANFITGNDIILLISAVEVETKTQSACFIRRCTDSRDKEGLAQGTGNRMRTTVHAGSAESSSPFQGLLPSPS